MLTHISPITRTQTSPSRPQHHQRSFPAHLPGRAGTQGQSPSTAWAEPTCRWTSRGPDRGGRFVFGVWRGLSEIPPARLFLPQAAAAGRGGPFPSARPAAGDPPLRPRPPGHGASLTAPAPRGTRSPPSTSAAPAGPEGGRLCPARAEPGPGRERPGHLRRPRGPARGGNSGGQSQPERRCRPARPAGLWQRAWPGRGTATQRPSVRVAWRFVSFHFISFHDSLGVLFCSRFLFCALKGLRKLLYCISYQRNDTQLKNQCVLQRLDSQGSSQSAAMPRGAVRSRCSQHPGVGTAQRVPSCEQPRQRHAPNPGGEERRGPTWKKKKTTGLKRATRNCLIPYFSVHHIKGLRKLLKAP